MDFSPKIRSMFNVIIIATVEMLLLYNAVGLGGYALFGGSVKSNIFNNFSSSDTLIQVSRGLIGIAVIFHYPINIHVARSAFDQLRRLAFKEKFEEHVRYRRLMENTMILFVITVLIATQVEDLGLVFAIMGGLVSSIIVFVIPGILLCKDSLRTYKGYKLLLEQDDSSHND